MRLSAYAQVGLSDPAARVKVGTHLRLDQGQPSRLRRMPSVLHHQNGRIYMLNLYEVTMPWFHVHQNVVIF